MVRVITVHNFLGQNITQIEEPTASCIANASGHEMLLLALSTHCVEVWELMVSDIKLHTVFPTVDMINQMVHCTKEDYVVTLESKLSRDASVNNHTGKTINNFVRIYVNWAMVKDQSQPMRARIAGRVTPSLNRPLNSLEMIELPLSVQPTLIACCQSTGNLLVASGNSAILHEFKIETQQVSKMKFIDFEARPWSLGFSFSPTHMEIVEDFISIMDKTNLCVFRLTNSMYEDIDQLSSLTSTNSSSIDKTSISTDSSFVENSNTANQDDNTILQGINSKRKSSSQDLHFIMSENNDSSGISTKFKSRKHKSSKTSIWNKLETGDFRKIKSNNNDTVINLDHLLYNEKDELQKLIDQEVVDGNSQPLTINLPSISLERAGPGHTLSPFILNPSDTRIIIKTNSPDVGCSNPTDATCLTTYPFTAPVNRVALEHTALHALTEAGLESYTLRLSHHVARMSNDIENLRVMCPRLRPFLGIQQLLHSKNYLILLAKAENSWTLYSLILPKLENLYYDILNAARNHKSSSPNTYRHLLGEAHALIRLAKDAVYNCSDINEFDDIANKNGLKLKNLYNQSCALLGDYYIRSEYESDWDFCIPYYKMSGLKPSEVLSRKSSQDAPGLVTFLTDTLFTMKSGSEADALFQGFNIVEIICKLKKPDLLILIFSSPVLREYTTEKLIHLLLLYETDELIKLALALLYIQAEKQEQAEKILEPVSALCIKRIVLEHWDLLFDMTAMKKRSPMIPTFSDFAGTLMRQKNATFHEILIQLIEEDGILSLHQIIQVFLEYLPSRVGRDGHNAAMTLQVFLEKYLHNYFSTKLIIDSSVISKNQIRTDFALIEAFKLLVRSYLGKLTQTKVYKIENKENIQENCDNFIFMKFRPHYLNGMPPYAKDYQKVLNVCDLKDLADIDKTDNEKTIPMELFKLQSVLSCDFIPNECLYEVKQFLETQEIDGSLSLKTLCTQNTEEATALLMDNCSQAVVQYAKDMYTKDSEWKYLIELTQSKIATSNSRQELQCLYTQIMKAILNYLPHTLSLKSLHRVLPKDDLITFQKCSEMCNQIMHAEHVKSLIIETGQQLLSTLKL
ncbi:Hermansky-Pudlak syndrome 3 protein like protein [Melipona quadrifasciata]|uniref:Hermansky-Pudlak syndrome 3 protein like protein n=1 Tax=Melipona quadrifasciata TaxID=166423 RepID=A0A0N1IU47_9HYME|nr:Hermansky-Pudlak syndrome 3 protein like protein [Melipona quadrifasciata]